MIDRYATLRQGLVGAWCPSSQPGGALLVDRSPYMTNPALTGFSWSAVGGGAAINGDGTSARATVGDLPRFRLTTCTITGWLRVSSQGSNMRCIFSSLTQGATFGGMSMGISIGNTSPNALAVALGNNTGLGASNLGIYTTSRNVCDGILHSFACVIIGASAQFYVDGVSITTSLTYGTALAAAYAATNYVTVGAEQTAAGSTGKFWSGLLDDVRVYDRALPLSEIKLLASQRGIGLVPTRRRRARLAASAATTMWLKVGGVWKTTTPHINVGGTWKAATPKINVGGTWKG